MHQLSVLHRAKPSGAGWGASLHLRSVTSPAAPVVVTGGLCMAARQRGGSCDASISRACCRAFLPVARQRGVTFREERRGRWGE